MGHGALGLVDEAADIAAADVQQHAPRSRPFSLLIIEGPIVTQVDDLSSGTWAPLLPVTRTFRELLRVLAEVARIADADGKTLAAFDGGGEVLAADRGFDRVLHVADVESVAVGGGAVDGHFQIRCAGGAFGIEVGCAGDLAHDLLDLVGLLFDDARSGPKTLMPIWVRMPVESMSMRLRMGCVQMLVTPGICSLSSSRAGCILGRALGPLVLRLEGDGGFGHVDGRGIGGGFGAADFADDHGDLRVGGDDASCWRRISVASVSEMRGSVMGMKSAVSSSSGGMNSEPMVVAR